MSAMNFKQELTGAFGKPISDNPTQPMVEAAYQHHKLKWRYLTIEVDPVNLGDAVRGARAMGFAGFNCTMPHKVAVIPYLDKLGQSASLMGAVNCVVRRGRHLIGENTDGKGFLKSLNELIDPRGKRVVIFGAGGAARAIAVELGLAAATHITIVNRSENRGQELLNLLKTKRLAEADLVLWKGSYSLPKNIDVVVNATSVGLFPDVKAKLDLEIQSLRPGLVVADVIPNPPRTNLIQDAQSRGCTTIDGLGMLVNQGIISIQHWTGIDPDPTVMRAALEKIISNFENGSGTKR